ncbi:MAG: glycosyltransferase family 4 protein [Acidimicrobiales bacterium]
MRVAVTVEQAWHPVPGGIGVSTVELLGALRNRAALDLVGVAARHREPPAEPWRPPIPVRHLPLPRVALYDAWHTIRWPAIERATGPVDVVHAMYFAIPPCRAPLVATFHDLLFLAYPEHYTWHTRWVFNRALELARRHARLVMCPSQATIDECRQAGFDADQLRLVPWGVRPETSAPGDQKAVRERYHLDRPYVMFCGTVEPRKNLPRVIEAFRAVDRPELELVIVGPRGWREDLDTAVDRSNGRVRLLGFVPRRDVDALYAGAALVVYPSLREGFGLPVLEAMAQGAAVVTSRGTATEEAVGDAGLLVDPLDVDAIAAAIVRLLDDRALADRLGAAARARAGTFTWDRTADLVADVYREAVDGNTA